MNICACGKKYDSSAISSYTYALYDDKNTIIRSICIHGIKIGDWSEIDRRKEYYPFLEPFNQSN